MRGIKDRSGPDVKKASPYPFRCNGLNLTTMEKEGGSLKGNPSGVS